MAFLSNYLTRTRSKIVASYVRGDVLDLGCGEAQVLSRHGSQIKSYCGIERSAQRVEGLKQRYPQAKFYRRDLDAERLALESTFDCVLMVALIEHLFNQKFVMSEVAQVLKPGGIVVLTTPTPFGNDVVHRAGASVGLFSRWAADDHIVLYNRHRFGILAKEIGLGLKRHEYFQMFCNQLAILENVDSKARSARVSGR